jgi:hypothetical protein
MQKLNLQSELIDYLEESGNYLLSFDKKVGLGKTGNLILKQLKIKQCPTL